jgi:adenylyltransferase/sulfurtransferase
MVPSCAEGGVLGILPGTVGLMQATEAVKQIIGKGRSLVGRMMQYDALEMTFKEFKLRRDPQCPVCGDNPTVTELIDYEQFCGVGRGGEEEADLDGVREISVQTLKQWMDEKKKFRLIDVREETEWEICNIPGATLMPLGTLSANVNQIDSSDEVVLQCKSGARSAKACKLLQKFGYKKIYNLEGGIIKWAEEIDSSMPTY